MPPPWPRDESASLDLASPSLAADAARVAGSLGVAGWVAGAAGGAKGAEAGWATPSARALGGGITNGLAVVSGGSAGAPQLVVRVFGDGTDAFIDRGAEEAALAAARAAGLGAAVLGAFGGGRFERFLEGARTAEPAELGEEPLASAAPRLLRAVHALAPDLGPGGEGAPGRPSLWGRLRRWLDTAEREVGAQEGAAGGAPPAFDFATWRAELAWLEDFCARVDSPVVFCHNDALAANFMVGVPPEEGGVLAADGATRVQLIDFEYGGYSYRGFDLGNHFVEYAGFECDWSRYPAEARRRAFCKEYLGEDASDEQVSALVLEASAFALASHQFWGIWAALQSVHSKIDFDYKCERASAGAGAGAFWHCRVGCVMRAPDTRGCVRTPRVRHARLRAPTQDVRQRALGAVLGHEARGRRGGRQPLSAAATCAFRVVWTSVSITWVTSQLYSGGARGSPLPFRQCASGEVHALGRSGRAARAGKLAHSSSTSPSRLAPVSTSGTRYPTPMVGSGSPLNPSSRSERSHTRTSISSVSTPDWAST